MDNGKTDFTMNNNEFSTFYCLEIFSRLIIMTPKFIIVELLRKRQIKENHQFYFSVVFIL